jgi:alpha-glucoside transport system ATP-binding protein
MSALSLKAIRKAYGAVEIIKGVDLEIASGEFIVFVGPSGCGKSTLLRMIAGLESITAGELSIGGNVVNDIPPSKRGIAMVFQSYALYPHMTVYDNMAFAMRLAHESQAEIDKRVRATAEILHLTPYLQRLPKALSGGQRQRVAIGRAIVRNPQVFLFDEPLSNLDAALRVATRIEIAKLHEDMPDTTMIYVTHDQVEAMTLADRIVVLSAGRIEQVGSPMELYDRPANLFVARFIGSPAMNVLKGRIARAGKTTAVELEGGGKVTLPIATAASQAGGKVSFGVRPEHLEIATGRTSVLQGEVTLVESLGEVTLVYLKAAGSAEPVIAKLPGSHSFERGATLKLQADPARMHLFGADGRSLRG